MPVIKGQGQSEFTKGKQDRLNLIVSGYWYGKAISAIKSYQEHNWAVSPEIIFIDAYAGAGFNDKENCDGSPVILAKIAEARRWPYKLYCIEKDKVLADQLRRRLAGYNAEVVTGDNKQYLPQIIDSLPSAANFGIVYLDPNGIPCWDIIKEASRKNKAKKLDIMVRYNASAHWRSLHLKDKSELKQHLDEIAKENVYATEPECIGPRCWSTLLMMNYEFSGWQSKGLYQLKTKNGQAILDSINLGSQQRKKKASQDSDQLPLIGLMQNTSNIPRLRLSGRKPSAGPVGSVRDAIIGLLRKFTI